MAWTYDTLLEAVRSYLDPTNDSAFDGQFPTFVRQAEERILHVTKVPAIRHRQSYANIASEVVATPPGFLGPIFMRSEDRVLLLKETSWIAEVYGDNTAAGIPEFYALRPFNSIETLTEIIVAPVPSIPTNFTIEYFRKPFSLTEVPQGETTWIARNAENALMQGTLFYAYQYEKGEADMLASYLNDFEKAMSLLKVMARTDFRRDENRSSPQAMPET